MKNRSPFVIWVSGLPCSGKTSICQHLRFNLNDNGIKPFCLDGDTLRQGLCSDLDFSMSDRDENVRRAGELAKLLYDQGCFVLCSFVTPLEKQRAFVRSLFPPNHFLDVYARSTLQTRMARDKKGLYRKAFEGEIRNFTGFDLPYEEPKSAGIIVDTSHQPIHRVVQKIESRLWGLEG